MRKARFKDLNKIEEIILSAKKSLKEDGIDQWQIDSLNREFLKNQLEKEKSYVFEKDGRILAYAFLSDKKEENYNPIEEEFEGKDYLTIHTLAVANDFKEKRIGTRFLIDIINFANTKGLDSLRIDTHEDNLKMRGLINKIGFKKRGLIFVDDEGSPKPRFAYELIL